MRYALCVERIESRYKKKQQWKLQKKLPWD
jgi:hypothetical protein